MSGRWFLGEGEFDASRSLILQAARLFKGGW